MCIFSVQEWLEKTVDGEIIYFFRGVVSSKIIVDALDDIEIKLEKSHSLLKLRKRVYNVLVESMQNLYHHAKEIDKSDEVEQGKYAVCLLARKTNGYTLTEGNFVSKKQKDFLTKHLDSINSMDEEGLKSLYRDILNNQGFSAKGGGGLGLVDIARKSESKLNYEFFEYDNDSYFFSLKVDITE